MSNDRRASADPRHCGGCDDDATAVRIKEAVFCGPCGLAFLRYEDLVESTETSLPTQLEVDEAQEEMALRHCGGCDSNATVACIDGVMFCRACGLAYLRYRERVRFEPEHAAPESMPGVDADTAATELEARGVRDA